MGETGLNVPDADIEQATRPTRRKPYRLIYQMAPTATLNRTKDADDYLKVFGFLEDSHVDALFWGDGAGGNTANYESDVLELTGARIGKVKPIVLKLIREGNDLPKIVPPAVKKLSLIHI